VNADKQIREDNINKNKSSLADGNEVSEPAVKEEKEEI